MNILIFIGNFKCGFCIVWFWDLKYIFFMNLYEIGYVFDLFWREFLDFFNDKWFVIGFVSSKIWGLFFLLYYEFFGVIFNLILGFIFEIVFNNWNM